MWAVRVHGRPFHFFVLKLEISSTMPEMALKHTAAAAKMDL